MFFRDICAFYYARCVINYCYIVIYVFIFVRLTISVKVTLTSLYGLFSKASTCTLYRAEYQFNSAVNS